MVDDEDARIIGVRFTRMSIALHTDGGFIGTNFFARITLNGEVIEPGSPQFVDALHDLIGQRIDSIEVEPGGNLKVTIGITTEVVFGS